MQGMKSTPEFTKLIQQWIDEGWIFDWLLGDLFEKNVKDKDDWMYNDDYGEIYTSVDAWSGLLEFWQHECFIPRMHMLLERGMEPTIWAHQLNNTIPNVRRMNREDHYKLEVLSSNITFLVDNNIKIKFDFVSENDARSDEHTSIYMTMLKLVNAYVDLPYALARWTHELKTDKRDGLPWQLDAVDASTWDSTYMSHFKRYQTVVPERLAQLMIHLAQPHGSNVWKVARKNTMSHILNGGYQFATDAAYYNSSNKALSWRRALFEALLGAGIFEPAVPLDWQSI